MKGSDPVMLRENRIHSDQSQNREGLRSSKRCNRTPVYRSLMKAFDI